tara:strand:- start:690 stop:908 length:219 start_codon:yes stop_codon:yes gene_type:complete
MFYQLLNSKVEAWEKCVNVTKVLLMVGNVTFSFLTFLYLKYTVDALENIDFNSTFSLFRELKECIVKSHICG